MKDIGVWGVVLCKLAEIYLNLKGACCCFHPQGRRALKMMAVGRFKMSVNFYQTILHHISEDRIHSMTNSF
jgi:hypothetical protein